MSSSRQEVIRYGSNQIRGFVGEELTLSITPTSVLIPAVVIDHLDMPCSFKDKEVSADAINFTSNDSTHAQTVAATGDLNLTSPTSVKLTAGTTIDVTGDLRLPVTTDSTSYLPLQEAGYFTDALAGTVTGVVGTTTVFLWRLGHLVFLVLQGMTSDGQTLPNTASHCSFGDEHMPAQFRPARDITVPVRTLVSTGGAPAYQTGHARILSTGVINVYATEAADSVFGGGFAGTPVGYTQEGFDDVVAHWYVNTSS